LLKPAGGSSKLIDSTRGDIGLNEESTLGDKTPAPKGKER